MNTKARICTAAMLALLAGVAAAGKPMSSPTASASAPTSKTAATKSTSSHALAPVRIDGAWVRAAPPGADMLAAYMDVHNLGSKPLRLVSASSDAFGMVELHRSQLVNGMSSMRPAGEQTIAAGGTLAIRPGGLHWMLMDGRRALKPGDVAHFTLHFADGSKADVTAPVRSSVPEELR
ncbi:MAG: copper chaperone PCu(A)C [Proteobacteria bacterium]|nr:copper chaperone PCu(A)C [Pseudomonadota bacterium]